MRFPKFIKHNDGSTLVLVIVCMLFVGIVASLILVFVSDNLQTMQKKGMASDNFYTAENVVDVIKTDLDELSDQAVRKAYGKWLQLYTTTAANQQEKLFKQLFATELELLLESQFIPNVTLDPAQLLYPLDSSKVEWMKNPYVSIDADGTCLTLKDISVKYMDNKGLTSYITTDMVVDLSYPGFQTNTVRGMNLVAANYIIIADEQITNNVTINGVIKGNLYGGGYNPVATTADKYNTEGILFNSNSALQIYADKILSRSTIKIADHTSVDIKGINGEYDYTGTLSYSDIWARNLQLGGASSQSDSVEMKVQGNCYLADDLTLDAEASKFVLKGTYYGYSTNNAFLGATDNNGVSLVLGTPEGSSSIVLNARDSVLDMREASKIWIAGKSFVSVPYRYGLGATAANVTFGQGESISYRGLQASYLVPGNCIMGIGHNPMTKEEYNTLTADPAKYYVDIAASRRSGGLRLENYVNRSKPYRAASVDYNDSVTMVYLYLNFQSMDKATLFSEDYMSANEELVNSRMDNLLDGKILFNPAVLDNTGNAVSYSDGKLVNTPSEYSISDSAIENKQIELSSRYSGLVTSLNSDYVGANMNGFLTDYIVDMSKITQNVQEETDLNYQPAGIPYKLITGEDVIINTNTTGIVIAKGDVEILNSASFTGIIIARGKVTTQGTVNLKADPDNISYLIQNNPTVSRYFSINNSGNTGDGNSIFASDLISISYDNWYKN